MVNRNFALQEGDLSKCYVLPANEVLALVQVYQQLKQANPGAQLLDASELSRSQGSHNYLLKN